jgi:hypothetical protein
MLFGSTALEVAIGLIFVFLLMSLLCSAVVEYAEAKLNYRSKDLEKGIRLLLDQYVPGEISTGKAGEKVNSLADALYKHPLVKSLYRGEKLPSYIPSRTFALALWDMAFPADARAAAGVTKNLNAVRASVSGNTFIGEDLRKSLLALIDDAQGDFDKARKNVEDWYDSTMDRVSGWYKRRVHYILLVTGLLVATLVNADTINIAKALMLNDSLRAAVVSAAEKAATTPTPAPTPTPADPREQARLAGAKIHEVRAQLGSLGIPIGWVRNPTIPDDPRRFPDTAGSWILKILGLLITAFAVSQGAPFWFDMLNKIIVIRSTVKPKEKSPEQPSKDKPAPDTEEEKKKPDVSNKS